MRLSFIARRISSAVRYGRVCGHSAKSAIQQRLLLEAQRLLRLSSLPVGQVAERLGYRDVFSFSRAFRSVVGVSPRRFRSLPSVDTD